VAIIAAIEAFAFKFGLVSDLVGAILLVFGTRGFSFVSLSLPWCLAALGTLVTMSTLGTTALRGSNVRGLGSVVAVHDASNSVDLLIASVDR
jgi:hypothetical protein